jgi:hypothetical protein
MEYNLSAYKTQMFPFLAMWNKFAGTPMKAPFDGAWVHPQIGRNFHRRDIIAAQELSEDGITFQSSYRMSKKLSLK